MYKKRINKQISFNYVNKSTNSKVIKQNSKSTKEVTQNDYPTLGSGAKRVTSNLPPKDSEKDSKRQDGQYEELLKDKETNVDDNKSSELVQLDEDSFKASVANNKQEPYHKMLPDCKKPQPTKKRDIKSQEVTLEKMIPQQRYEIDLERFYIDLESEECCEIKGEELERIRMRSPIFECITDDLEMCIPWSIPEES